MPFLHAIRSGGPLLGDVASERRERFEGQTAEPSPVPQTRLDDVAPGVGRLVDVQRWWKHGRSQ